MKDVRQLSKFFDLAKPEHPPTVLAVGQCEYVSIFFSPSLDGYYYPIRRTVELPLPPLPVIDDPPLYSLASWLFLLRT